MTTAQIFYQYRLAGVLRRTDGEFQFVYDPGYLADPQARPISLAMPLRPEAYSRATLFPFFEGLLPEGWLLRFATAALHIDASDQFALLLRLGTDPIGAVSIRN